MDGPARRRTVTDGIGEQRAQERGVTYLALMLVVVLMGISFTALAREWKVLLKRDREAELLFRGNRIKTALEQFGANYEVMKSTRDHRFPLTLEEMTKPPKPTLQRVYKDPMTGEDFALLRVNGEIVGVHSRSKERPLDRVNFRDAPTYSEVLFKAELATGQPCAAGLNQLNPLAASTPLPGSPPTPAAGSPAPGTQPAAGPQPMAGNCSPSGGMGQPPAAPGQAPTATGQPPGTPGQPSPASPELPPAAPGQIPITPPPTADPMAPPAGPSMF